MTRASNLSVGTKAWADKINSAWRASALMVATEVGQHLIDAKANVPHGDFERMVRLELDFSPQTARKLMAVAADKRIRNRFPGRVPEHWTIYYELTKLSDDDLDEAYRTGVINSQMRRVDVPRRRKESPQGGAVPAEGSSEIPPLAPPDAGPPQDGREGEDSAVTDPGIPPLSVHPDYDPTEANVASPMHPTATSDERDEAGQQPRAGAAGAPDSRVTFAVKPDAISRLATGLALAMAASRGFEPRAALAAYPKDMLPKADELAEFTTWLLTFEDLNTERESAAAAE